MSLKEQVEGSEVGWYSFSTSQGLHTGVGSLQKMIQYSTIACDMAPDGAIAAIEKVFLCSE
ncbi:MAG TPA: hypothetical protein V6D26_16905 [Stenomitos sp.]